jgi:hypothetical protein
LTKGTFLQANRERMNKERSVSSDIMEGVFWGLLSAAIAVGMLYLIFS